MRNRRSKEVPNRLGEYLQRTLPVEVTRFDLESVFWRVFCTLHELPDFLKDEPMNQEYVGCALSWIAGIREVPETEGINDEYWLRLSNRLVMGETDILNERGKELLQICSANHRSI